MDSNTKRIERAPETPKLLPEVPLTPALEVNKGLSETEREQLRSEVLSSISQQERMPSASAVIPAAVIPAISAKSEIRQKIENVLEEDLKDAYFKMEPELQAKFKHEGEQTAEKIEDLFSRGKATAHKIFKLVLAWLKLIPGMNKLFIKQEAKIKADRIMGIKK